MKTFVFSLDNKKIYYLENHGYNAVYHSKYSGPCFGIGRDIGIIHNILKDKSLFTKQISFKYDMKEYALSEFTNEKRGNALEYEVYQVIFN